MKNKFEANIAQSKMQSEKMLKTMQQLSADAVYTGAFEMSLDEINAEKNLRRWLTVFTGMNLKSPYILHAFFRLSLSSGQDAMIWHASSFLLSR